MLVSSTGISVMKADEDIGLAAKFIVTTNSIVPLERLEISRMVLLFFHSLSVRRQLVYAAKNRYSHAREK